MPDQTPSEPDQTPTQPDQTPTQPDQTPTQMVPPATLIAALPKWWDRWRAVAKVAGTTMVRPRDRVMTLGEDRKHVDLVDTDKFSATQQVDGQPEPEATGSAPDTEPRS